MSLNALKKDRKQKLNDVRIIASRFSRGLPEEEVTPKLAYLDFNNRTPLAKEIADNISSWLDEYWMHPNSSNEENNEALEHIRIARAKVAKLIDANADEIVFTISVAEGFKQILSSARGKFQEFLISKVEKPHVIASAIEPQHIRYTLEKLRDDNTIDLTVVPCFAGRGTFKIEEVLAAIQPRTCLVCASLTNGITGVIQPVMELSHAMAQLEKNPSRCSIFLYSDFSQVIGKIMTSVKDLDVDFATMDGSKFYGPKLSAMYFRNEFERKKAIYYNGKKEYGIRPGEDNTAFIIGIGRAADIINQNLASMKSDLQSLKEYFEKRLKRELSESIVLQRVSFDSPHLPNTICLSFKSKSDLEKIKTINFLKANIQYAATTEFKETLKASGFDENVIPLTLSLSLGKETRGADIDYYVGTLKEKLGN